MKFYIQRPGLTRREFIIAAPSVCEAIAKFWKHEFRFLHTLSGKEISELPAEFWTIPDVCDKYLVHSGRRKLACVVQSGPASHLLSDKEQRWLISCLRSYLTEDEFIAFVESAGE